MPQHHYVCDWFVSEIRVQKRGQITLGVFPKYHKHENKIDFCLISNSGLFQIIKLLRVIKMNIEYIKMNNYNDKKSKY